MRKSTPVQYLIRAGIYCLGLLFLAFGVALSVNSNLGVSPVNSLPYVISKVVNVQMGTCVTIVFCAYILMPVLILRKEFNPINLLQIVFSTIFGYFVDFAKWVVGSWAIPTYFGSLVMLAVSIVLIAIGILLYMGVEMVPMPMEGLSAALAKKTGMVFHKMKMIVDCIVVAVGLILCLVFLGKLDGLREGTIITAVAVGPLMGVIRAPITRLVKKLSFGTEE